MLAEFCDPQVTGSHVTSATAQSDPPLFAPPTTRRRLVVFGGSLVATLLVARYSTFAFQDIRAVPLMGVFLMAYVALRFMVYRDARDTVLLAVAAMTFTIYIRPLFDPDFNFIRTHFFYHENVVAASWYALIGFACMLLGYSLTKGLRAPRVLPKIGRTRIPPNALVVISTGLMAGSIFTIVFRDVIQSVGGVFGRLLFLLDQFPLLAIGVGFLAIMEGHRGIAFRILLFGIFIPLEVLVIVARTLFYHLLILAAPLTLMYMLRRRRIPFVPLAIALVLLFPAFKTRVTTRGQVGYNDTLSLPQLVSTGYSYIATALRDRTRDERIAKVQKDAADARTNSLSLLAHVVRVHESEGREYKYGATFWWLPLTPVPRMILPMKPSNNHSTTFPMEYGMMIPGARYALVLPLLVETYINGGVLGVIILNFLIGAAFCLLPAMFEHGQGVVNMMGLLSVIALSVYVENNITMLFGGALQAMLVWFVVDKLLARRRATRARASPAYA